MQGMSGSTQRAARELGLWRASGLPCDMRHSLAQSGGYERRIAFFERCLEGGCHVFFVLEVNQQQTAHSDIDSPTVLAPLGLLVGATYSAASVTTPTSTPRRSPCQSHLQHPCHRRCGRTLLRGASQFLS